MVPSKGVTQDSIKHNLKGAAVLRNIAQLQSRIHLWQSRQEKETDLGVGTTLINQVDS